MLAPRPENRPFPPLARLADELPDRVEEGRDRDRLRDIGLATPFADPLLVAFHGEGRDGNDRDFAQLVVLFQPFGDFEARNLRELNIHQNEIGPMLAGERERLHAVSRLERLVAMRIEQIMNQLHVQLVVLDDQNGLGHGAALGQRIGRPMMGDLVEARHGARSGFGPPKHGRVLPILTGSGVWPETPNEFLAMGGPAPAPGRLATVREANQWHSGVLRYSSEVSVPWTEKLP